MVNPADMFGEEYRPARRNSAGVKCGACKRIFAAGYVPPPQIGGPYDGTPICRDCLHQHHQSIPQGTKPLF